MEKLVEQRFKACGRRIRRRKNRIIGLKLELMVMEALKRMGQIAGTDFLSQWTYCPNGDVDWIWHVEGWELECKRLRGNYLLNKYWLQKNVVERFSDKAERKVLVTTRKAWDGEGDEYLKANNVDVIITGRIDNKAELEAGIEKFTEQFLELVDRAAEEELEVMV